MSFEIDRLFLDSNKNISERVIDNMEKLLEEERRAVLREKQEERYRSKIDFLDR